MLYTMHSYIALYSTILYYTQLYYTIHSQYIDLATAKSEASIDKFIT